MNIQRLGVRERLCAAFAIIGLLPIVSAGVAWFAFAHMEHAINDIARDKLPQIEGSLAVARRADLLVSDGYQLLDSSTENDRKSRAAAVADASSGAVALLKKLRDDGANVEAVSAIESRLAD